MLFGRLIILALVCCAAGRDPLPAAGTRATDHPATPVIGASARHLQPADGSEMPFPQEEDLLPWLSDCTDAAPSPAALPLLPTPCFRPANPGRTPSLFGATELLYSLRRLRI
jgi:hypothetical protein